MQIIDNPGQNSWQQLAGRPVMEAEEIDAQVQPVLDAVRKEGDAALYRYTEQFDGVALDRLEVQKEEFDEAEKQVSPELKYAIDRAAGNIKVFHDQQWEQTECVETEEGVSCWRKSVPIEKVGLYIPGGTAPLFSTILMLGVPAKIAGCREIVLCTPPGKNGKVNPVILYTARLLGLSRVIKAGGAQAIASMAYGTETVPKVYKIFGPGNQYVTSAKKLIYKDGVGIDLPAGPSEVAVVADETANPAFIASDLLSQAEHGPDSQVVLVTTKRSVAEAVQKEVEEQLAKLPRQTVAEKALEYSRFIVFDDKATCMDFVNFYAPEHLILQLADAREAAEEVVNAGSVFIGNYTPEVAGDYASGTNHTLPTNGTAVAWSGVSLDSFLKKITFQEISEKGLGQLSESLQLMAEAEELIAHKNAVQIRMDHNG